MLLPIHAVTHTLRADTRQALTAAAAAVGWRAGGGAAHNGAMQPVAQRDGEAACRTHSVTQRGHLVSTAWHSAHGHACVQHNPVAHPAANVQQGVPTPACVISLIMVASQLTPECLQQHLLQPCWVKGGQETQAAQVERHQRRHRPAAQGTHSNRNRRRSSSSRCHFMVSLPCQGHPWGGLMGSVASALLGPGRGKPFQPAADSTLKNDNTQLAPEPLGTRLLPCLFGSPPSRMHSIWILHALHVVRCVQHVLRTRQPFLMLPCVRP